MSNTKTVSLTDAEREMLYYALHIRICLIETGSPTVRAADIRQHGEDFAKALGASLCPLGTDQMRAIIALEDLAAKVL